MDTMKAIANRFQLPGHIDSISELEGGNINRTFLVSFSDCHEKIILQCINSHVFPEPEMVIKNMALVLEHIQKRVSMGKNNIAAELQVLRIFSGRDSKNFVIDDKGGYWRALNFIDRAITFETIQNLNHARETGRALGRFHHLVSDLDPAGLYDTLPGFHVTPAYLDYYDFVINEKDKKSKSSTTLYCKRFIDNHRDMVTVLEDALRKKILVKRIIHGDPKISNIMIDNDFGRSVGMIDLDTVKPGLIHYDIGDCLRSCCNKSGEETTHYDKIDFDLTLCRAIVDGYVKEADDFLSENDYNYLYDAVRLLAFELGLRFFTDFLEDNIYFKVKQPAQNLNRALVQFKLVESIEAKENEIRQLVTKLK